MITSIFVLILFHVMVGTENLQPFLQIGQALISVLLHGFGFFVIYRSSALGLRVVISYEFHDSTKEFNF